MKFHIAALTTVILIFSSLAWSADYRFDGNWWIDQKMNEKDFYLIGLFDGMDLGHRFSCWKFLSNKTKADQSCFAKVRDSFKEYNQEYFSNVTIGQLSDGLDLCRLQEPANPCLEGCLDSSQWDRRYARGRTQQAD